MKYRYLKRKMGWSFLRKSGSSFLKPLGASDAQTVTVVAIERNEGGQ